MAIGIANIVISARKRRSRTSRRLVDSPSRSSGRGSSRIVATSSARWHASNRYTRRERVADGHRGTAAQGDLRVRPGAPAEGDDDPVFILYAVIAGLVIGMLSGGS